MKDTQLGNEMNRLIYLCLLAISCSACITKLPNNAAMEQINLCNAGSKISLSANLEAKVEENLKRGLKANAGIDTELRGLFLNNAKVSEANAVALYDKYLQCLEQTKI